MLPLRIAAQALIVGQPDALYRRLTPAASRENLNRLAAALDDLRVGLRAPDLDEPIAFEFDATSITRFTTLTTRGAYGDLDVVLRLAPALSLRSAGTSV